MFAIAAAVCFAIALILNILGHGELVTDFELGGLLAVALHMCGFAPWTYTRR